MNLKNLIFLSLCGASQLLAENQPITSIIKIDGITTPIHTPIAVPFLSLHSRRELLEKNNYFPENALIIKTKLGDFALWRDETGIMCIRRRTEHNSEEDCFEKTLMKAKKREQLALALLVNRLGNLEIERRS